MPDKFGQCLKGNAFLITEYRSGTFRLVKRKLEISLDHYCFFKGITWHNSLRIINTLWVY